MQKTFPLLFLLLFTMSNYISAQQQEIAIILKSNGLVSVSCHNRNEFVSKGYLILPGTVLQTGNKGFVKIKFIGSMSTIIVRPRSEIMLNAYSEASTVTESIEMRQGELLFSIKKPHKHNFDLYLPATLITLDETNSLAIMSTNSDNCAVYNLEGTINIADDNYENWKSIEPGSAIFSTVNGFMQTSKISTKTLPRLSEIYENTKKFKSGLSLVHDLIIKSPPNGNVEPSGKLVVLNGVDIEIKAFPDESSVFAGWRIVDGNATLKKMSEPQTDINIFSDVLIEAQFEETPSILHIGTSKYGITEPSGDVFVQRKHPLIIRIKPIRGYTFSGWKKSGNIRIKKVNELNNAISLMSKKGKIYPRFTKKKYELSIVKSKHGTITPTKTKNVTHGDTIELTATPGNGFQFITWKIIDGFAHIHNMRDKKTWIICDSTDVTVQPIFSNNAVEISILDHDLADISPLGNFYVIRNSSFSVAANTKDGYTLSKWIVERGKARIKGLEQATIKCRTPFEIKPVIATKEYTLTMLSNDNGSTIPHTSKKVTHNKTVRIIAAPNPDRYFINWKLIGGIAEIKDNYNDTTDVILWQGNAIIQAIFAESVCSLSVTSTKGGYTEPDGKLTTYKNGDTPLKAVPNAKAAFIGWEIINNKDNIEFSDTITMAEQIVTSKGHASIEAVFSTETIEMSILTNGLGTVTPKGKFYAVRDRWMPLKAKPNENQTFVKWATISGNNVQFKEENNPITEVNPGTDNSVIKALFQPGDTDDDTINKTSLNNNFTLKIKFDKTKGTIDVNPEIIVKKGVYVRITAEPKQGYYVKEWKVKKGISPQFLTGRYGPIAEVSLSKGNATISPIFVLKSIHTLEIKFRNHHNKSKTITSKYR